MGLIIVSKNLILRNAIRSLCEARGVPVSDLFENCADIHQIRSGQVILFHLDNDYSPQQKILDFVKRFPGARLVILANDGLVETIEKALESQIVATVAESASAETLVSILIVATEGYNARLTVSPSETTLAVSDVLSNGDSARSFPCTAEKCPLSERELTVMAYLRSGYSNKAIGRALGIQDSTVKAHLRSSFRRIGATNRTQAAMWAMQHLPPNSGFVAQIGRDSSHESSMGTPEKPATFSVIW